MFKKIAGFFQSSYQELQKVVWPTWSSVTSSMKVVIVSTILAAIVLGVIDFLLTQGLLLLF